MSPEVQQNQVDRDFLNLQDCSVCETGACVRIQHSWASVQQPGWVFIKWECSKCHARRFERLNSPQVIEEKTLTGFPVRVSVYDQRAKTILQERIYCDRCHEESAALYPAIGCKEDICSRCSSEDWQEYKRDKGSCALEAPKLMDSDPEEAPNLPRAKFDLECGLCGEACPKLYPIDDGMVCEQCKKFVDTEQDEKAWKERGC